MPKNRSHFHIEHKSPVDIPPEQHWFYALSDSVTPDSQAPLNQKELIKDIEKAHNEDSSYSHGFFTKNTLEQVHSGVCTGMLYTWYDFLLEGHNLVDVIAKGCPNNLWARIFAAQQKYGFAQMLFPESVKPKKTSHKATQKWEDLSHFLPEESFVKVDEKQYTDNYSKNIKAHMLVLQSSGAANEGLHIIGYIHYKDDKKDDEGHIIGWTKVDDGYLLFDASQGEMFIKNYQKVIDVINHILLNRGGITAADYSVLMKDHYTTDDLESIAVLNANPKDNVTPFSL